MGTEKESVTSQSVVKPGKSADALKQKIRDLNSNPEVVAPVKKRPSSAKIVKDERRMFSLSGDIVIEIIKAPLMRVTKDGFETPVLVVDKLGNSFNRGVLELSVNGETSVALLDAKQVEIILKVLRVAPNSVQEQRDQKKDSDS